MVTESGRNGFTPRQDTLQKLLSVPAVETLGTRSTSPDTVVLLPIHDDPHRYETAALTLRSLTRQTRMGNVHVLIADNGISPDGRARLESTAEDLGLPMTMVSAHPEEDSQRSPAYARNQALSALRVLREQDVSLRGPVLEIDSDNMALPYAVDHMRETLYSQPDAVAVSGTIIPTQHLSEEAMAQVPEADPRENVTRVLPNLWTADGKVDVLPIVAFSSQVAGKTTGFLMDPDLVGTIMDYANEVYVAMPSKSAEDMIASTAFRRHGVIYHDPRARFLDEARESEQRERSQQLRWGRDHAVLVHDLQRLGLVQEGVQVLEPHGGSWVIWQLPGTEGMNGFVINPADIRNTAGRVSAALRNGIAHEFTSDQLVTLDCGLDVLGKILDQVDQTRPQAQGILRDDLPRPVIPDPDNPRFSTNAKNARLIGNLLGLSDIVDLERIRQTHSLPPAFLFGGRQAASWS